MTNEYGLKENNVQVIINANVIEDGAREQVELISQHPAFKGLISIQPDCHIGKGSVIGFTGKFNGVVIPNVVGVDISCGLVAYNLGKIDNIDYEAFDKDTRRGIPLGFNSHKNIKFLDRLSDELKARAIAIGVKAKERLKQYGKDKEPILQIGTMGGGNHFCELNLDEEGNTWIVIHSGSRNFGLQVANYHQRKAKKLCEQMKIIVPQDLEYLPMELGGNDYLKDSYIAQEYATVNRLAMLESTLWFFGQKFDQSKLIESIHNYINPKDNIVRKGAISAYVGEKVVIPLNMAQGTIIGVGKSTSKYNFSAPHGAGRVAGRKEMSRRLADGRVTMDQFKDSMKDVYSTCVDAKHIDESPFAYKSFSDIEEHLGETVEVLHRLKPVYNLKA